jgi:hypothetical protein
MPIVDGVQVMRTAVAEFNAINEAGNLDLQTSRLADCQRGASKWSCSLTLLRRQQRTSGSFVLASTGRQ